MNKYEINDNELQSITGGTNVQTETTNTEKFQSKQPEKTIIAKLAASEMDYLKKEIAEKFGVTLTNNPIA